MRIFANCLKIFLSSFATLDSEFWFIYINLRESRISSGARDEQINVGP